MVVLRVTLLCPLLLLPSLALAGPPDDTPPVQHPSETTTTPTETGDPDTAPAQGEDQSVTGDTVPTSTTEASTAPVTDPQPEAASGDAPADLDTTSDGAPAVSAPESSAEQEQEDLSNLLVSDEPDPTPRVRAPSGDKPRVDRNERLRNYYARLYRPDHNPARIHFAARGAYALSGTTDNTGGGRMGFANLELGQTWNFISYGVGASLYAGSLTFGQEGVEKFGGLLVGGGPSVGLGRLGLFSRGYFDARVGYNFFYAPVSSTREGMADPPDAAPHGPKVQLDAGLLFHDSESRRFRHGIGVSIGWQLLVHSFAGEYPVVNSFSVGVGYFFG